MGLFSSIFGDGGSTASSSSTTTEDNKVNNEGEASAVASGNSTINYSIQSKDSLELAGKSLDTAEGFFDKTIEFADLAFDKVLGTVLESNIKQTDSVVSAIQQNAQDSFQFVRDRSQTDFAQILKDFWPLGVLALAVWKGEAILNGFSKVVGGIFK